MAKCLPKALAALQGYTKEAAPQHVSYTKLPPILPPIPRRQPPNTEFFGDQEDGRPKRLMRHAAGSDVKIRDARLARLSWCTLMCCHSGAAGVEVDALRHWPGAPAHGGLKMKRSKCLNIHVLRKRRQDNIQTLSLNCSAVGAVWRPHQHNMLNIMFQVNTTDCRRGNQAIQQVYFDHRKTITSNSFDTYRL